MGIKFDCIHCGRRLNVKDHLAGKRGFCPHCAGRIQIPTVASTSTTSRSSPLHSRPAVGDVLCEAPEARWYVLPPGATKNYGPAAADVMRQWLQEGRLAADSMVWREGWADWRSAGDVFPQLNGGAVRREDHPVVLTIVEEGPLMRSSPMSGGAPSPLPAAHRAARQQSNLLWIGAIVGLAVLVVALAIALVWVAVGR